MNSFGSLVVTISLIMQSPHPENNTRGFTAFGIDKEDAKARALAIGKELLTVEEPKKEKEDEYVSDEDSEIN